MGGGGGLNRTNLNFVNISSASPSSFSLRMG